MSLLLKLIEYTKEVDNMISSNIYNLQKKYFIPNTTTVKKEKYNRAKTLKRRILGKYMKQKYNSFRNF